MTPQQKQVTYEHDGLTFHATRDYGGDAWTARVELEATGPDAEGAVSALQERARKFGEVGGGGDPRRRSMEDVRRPARPGGSPAEEVQPPRHRHPRRSGLLRGA